MDAYCFCFVTWIRLHSSSRYRMNVIYICVPFFTSYIGQKLDLPWFLAESTSAKLAAPLLTSTRSPSPGCAGDSIEYIYGIIMLLRSSLPQLKTLDQDVATVLKKIALVRDSMRWHSTLGFLYISNSGSANSQLPRCFCPWTFSLNIGLNMFPLDSFMSFLHSLPFPTRYSTGELQALQLIVLAAFGAVD